MTDYISREAALEFVEPDARPFLAERIKSIPAADVDFSGWVNCHDSSGLHTVTHWMELPALPEEAE